MDILGNLLATMPVRAKTAIFACIFLISPLLASALDPYDLTWDTKSDHAFVKTRSGAREIWHGSLLPALWVRTADGSRLYIKAVVVSNAQDLLTLRFSDTATGELTVRRYPEGIRFERLAIHWIQPAPAVVALYFGTALLTVEQRAMVPSLDLPFWPDWEADGFGIPSAKGGPLQSFFRRWDFGHADIALGSFGPAMGTPYGAAYPRPFYSAAMGGPDGWVAFGPGAVPDAALTLRIRSSNAALEFLYREDLWGAQKSADRVWDEPFRLFWAHDAWDAYLRLFQSFPAGPPSASAHQETHWNSWGNFRENHYGLRELADQVADDVGAKILVLDDGWETNRSSGIPNLSRYPNFSDDLAYIRKKGLELGFWQACGWVDEPEASGLLPEDLVRGTDGVPRRVNWAMSTQVEPHHYVLDPSSPRAREFLRQRTFRIMRELKPRLLKLDFGYALPGPDVAAPRDPAMRGERFSYTLLKTIADAAREIDPSVTIQYYSIHPLMAPIEDLITLDDLGDAGGQEATGHGEWSIWAALAGAQGRAINASSGYDWREDNEVLLDTAVIGAPGSILPLPTRGEAPAPGLDFHHRRALVQWYRHTTLWKPLWLNSEKGALGREPRPRCFGRLEPIGGEDRLTALVLRPEVAGENEIEVPGLGKVHWQGRWAIIAQDDETLAASHRLACIPFDGGSLRLPRPSAPARVMAADKNESPLTTWSWRDSILEVRCPISPELVGILVIN
ncbi:MAG: hypothetical protein ABSG32_20800 [Terriglobia bacterium]|jgi:hypothetical protein